MAKHRRSRSGHDLKRRQPTRPPYPRVLIVCEGAKTEVNYFEEIRQERRLPTLHCHVVHSHLGTEPQQIVEAADGKFQDTRGYEYVFAVFDRDIHLTYANAIAMAVARDGKLKNDEKVKVRFAAAVTVPCFELWLLLHYENILAPIHRHEALARVRIHMPGYEKGNSGTFAATVDRLDVARHRAANLKATNNRLSQGEEPYTDLHELVDFLRRLRD